MKHKYLLDYLNKFTNNILKNESNLFNKIQLNESSNLTYYELRKFISMLLKHSKKETTKEVLSEILKILGIMEIREMPVPMIKKQSKKSKKIWDVKNEQ